MAADLSRRICHMFNVGPQKSPLKIMKIKAYYSKIPNQWTCHVRGVMSLFVISQMFHITSEEPHVAFFMTL